MHAQIDINHIRTKHQIKYVVFLLAQYSDLMDINFAIPEPIKNLKKKDENQLSVESQFNYSVLSSFILPIFGIRNCYFIGLNFT